MQRCKASSKNVQNSTLIDIMLANVKRFKDVQCVDTGLSSYYYMVCASTKLEIPVNRNPSILPTGHINNLIEIFLCTTCVEYFFKCRNI